MCESPSKPCRVSDQTATRGSHPGSPPSPAPATSQNHVASSTPPVSLTQPHHTTASVSPDQSPKSEPRNRQLSAADVKIVTCPPDGGWGWVVVFCSFMVHVIADGVTYTFGIFYIELCTYFDASKGKTAWVASILVSTTFCVGPIASALTNIYGCRTVTIVGSILASFGMFISVWAPNVTFLFLSIGICTGVGLGLMYLPAIVSVSMYFDRKRAFATGIAVCGSGFGTFALAPVIEALVGYYTWKGAMMITSGLLLNCIVFGALMRAPDYIAVVEAVDAGDVDNNTLYSNENIKVENTEKLLKQSDGFLLPELKDKHHNRSICHLSVSSEPELVLIRTPSIDRNLYLDPEGLNFKQSYASLRKRISCTSQPSLSLHSVQLKDTRTRREKFASFVKTICDSIDLALLLKSRVFILFALSNFFTSIGFNVPYVYIADLAKRELHVDEKKASYLLSFIGLSNTASRVLLGYLSDKAFVNRILLYNLCIGTCGIATALSVLCTSYYQLALYCVVFGATSGAFISLTSVILVDLLGLEKLNNAFGLVLLFEGVACLIGPPLTGSLFDWTGSYTVGFVFSGIVIAAGGVMLFFIPCVQNDFEKPGPVEKVASIA